MDVLKNSFLRMTEDLINGEIQEEEKTEDDSLLLFDWSAIVRRYKKTKGKKF